MHNNMEMLDDYDIESLNPRRNPYRRPKGEMIAISLKEETLDYFKEMSSDSGIPYQTLINMYLEDCVREKKKLKTSWE